MPQIIQSESRNTLHAAESVNIREPHKDILIIQKKKKLKYD